MCNDCEEIIEKECASPCKEAIDASCVFYNVENKLNQNLNFLGIKGAVSFNHLLKRIDEKFSNSLATSFDTFNLYNLNNVKEIKTLRQFVETISEKIQSLFTGQSTLTTKVNSLETRIITLELQIAALTNPQISSTVLNINSTDTIIGVLNKYKVFLEQHNAFTSPTIETVDTSTVKLFPSGEKNHKLKADVSISELAGNRVIDQQGLYVGDPSASAFLDSILNQDILRKKFLGIVDLAALPLKFTIQNKSDDSTIINYISSENNQQQSVTVNAGTFKDILNVKEVLTNPHSQLVITNKGIHNGGCEL